MIVPSTAHVLRCVAFTMDNLVKPDPGGKGAASALATATHLIRYAGLRLEQEGPLLAADIRALRGLLPQLEAYLASLGAAEPGIDTARAELSAAVSSKAAPVPEQADLATLVQVAQSLREALYRTLRFLQGDLRQRRKDEADYQRVRGLIREYLAGDLEREASLIEPAFRGQGPRR
ncbi:MAG TPA: hypothetical protein VJM11_06210 [Nevskiaceae bacterium]|nr:hypothetical protein [Nevskiaceae bacterium]